MNINTEDLRKAFRAVHPVAKANATLPVLSHVRLRARKGQASLSACDLTREAHSRFSAAGDIDICVPAERMRALLDHAGDEIRIATKPPKCEAKSGRYRASLSILPGEDMPSLKYEGEEISLELPGLAEMIQSLAFATAKKDTRTFTLGVFLQSNGKEICAVASDGVMMGVRRIAHEAPEFDIMLHKDSVATPDFEVKRVVVVPKTAITYVGDESSLTTKAMLAAYPDWRSIMQGVKVNGTVTVDRQEFIEILRMAMPFAENSIQDQKVSIIQLQSKDGELIVTTVGKTDQIEASLPATAEGNALDMPFNGRLLLSIVERARVEKLVLGVCDQRLRITTDELDFVLTYIRL